MKHWKPQYRSLGAPPVVPKYLRYDDQHWPDSAGYVIFENVSLNFFFIT
jgi:hypothetical protein